MKEKQIPLKLKKQLKENNKDTLHTQEITLAATILENLKKILKKNTKILNLKLIDMLDAVGIMVWKRLKILKLVLKF